MSKPDRGVAADVLGRWGVSESTAKALPGGEIKENWLVDGGRLVLRVYPHDVPVAAVEQELIWLTALRGALPEIPEPVPSRHGRLVEQTGDGRAAVLARAIDGDPPDDAEATRASMADLLGRIHREAKRLGLHGEAWFAPQRSFDWSANPWWNLRDAALATLHPGIGTVREELGQVPDLLGRLEGLPECLVHNDFHRGNLIAAGHDIIGVVDWDWATVDWRVLDVAAGVRSWMFRPGQDGPGSAVDFVDHYSGVVGDFTEAERRLLPDVLWLRSLWTVFYDLGRATIGQIPAEDVVYRFDEHRRLANAIPGLREALG